MICCDFINSSFSFVCWAFWFCHFSFLCFFATVNPPLFFRTLYALTTRSTLTGLFRGTFCSLLPVYLGSFSFFFITRLNLLTCLVLSFYFFPIYCGLQKKLLFVFSSICCVSVSENRFGLLFLFLKIKLSLSRGSFMSFLSLILFSFSLTLPLVCRDRQQKTPTRCRTNSKAVLDSTLFTLPTRKTDIHPTQPTTLNKPRLRSVFFSCLLVFHIPSFNGVNWVFDNRVCFLLDRRRKTKNKAKKYKKCQSKMVPSCEVM